VRFARDGLLNRLATGPSGLPGATRRSPCTRWVAAAILWLIRPMQSWITGQTIGGDGGLADLKLGA
jgi:NAD(P)-dependent dehydrogenase (short-subunit alcohol dehydrogenase family)